MLALKADPQVDSAPAEDEPLFRSAFQAVRFAVTRDGRAPRPASSRMLDTTNGARDLTPLDAAAQAGMILNVLEGLGRLPMAVLVARAAPLTSPCECRRPCCSGRRANRYWSQALDTIAQDSRRALPPGSKLSYALRSSILVKIYGLGRVTFKDISDDLMIDQETVSRQHRAIHRWLMGDRSSRHAQAIEGIDPLAWQDAETALRKYGIVG